MNVSQWLLGCVGDSVSQQGDRTHCHLYSSLHPSSPTTSLETVHVPPNANELVVICLSVAFVSPSFSRKSTVFGRIHTARNQDLNLHTKALPSQ